MTNDADTFEKITAATDGAGDSPNECIRTSVILRYVASVQRPTAQRPEFISRRRRHFTYFSQRVHYIDNKDFYYYLWSTTGCLPRNNRNPWKKLII